MQDFSLFLIFPLIVLSSPQEQMWSWHLSFFLLLFLFLSLSPALSLYHTTGMQEFSPYSMSFIKMQKFLSLSLSHQPHTFSLGMAEFPPSNSLFLKDAGISLFLKDAIISLFLKDAIISLFLRDARISLFLKDARISLFLKDARISLFHKDARISLFHKDARFSLNTLLPIIHVGGTANSRITSHQLLLEEFPLFIRIQEFPSFIKTTATLPSGFYSSHLAPLNCRKVKFISWLSVLLAGRHFFTSHNKTPYPFLSAINWYIAPENPRTPSTHERKIESASLTSHL